VVIKAIQHNIAIYAIHTALDNHWQGVNYMICEKLGLLDQEVLIPKGSTIKKLNTFIPSNQLEKVKNALFKIGAGHIGNYENCSFTSHGTGSFKGNNNSNPSIGEKNQLQQEEETQLQLTFASHLTSKIIQTLHQVHPYEEVAYEITTLENVNQKIGMGRVGELPQALSETEALQLVKDTFNSKGIRHSAFRNIPVKRIAVLGGSGAFAIKNAIRSKADLFITADVKYHEFYQAENKLIVADIGHYESEQYTKNLIVTLLRKKISNFAPIFNLEDIILEVEDLEDEVAGLHKRLEKLNNDVTAFDDNIKGKKIAIDESKQLIKKYKEQQDNVRNNREFNSLSKEVEFQELEMELAEKHIKEFKAQIIQKKEVIESTEEKISSRTAHLEHKKGELDEILAETQKEEQGLIGKSEDFGKKIDERLVNAYKRIRGNVKNGLAVVPVERGASGGSYFTIPPQIQMEIASRKKIITDEHSGRILVDLELANEEKIKMEKLFAKF